MDVGRRAKQFAPFAALRGLDETIRQAYMGSGAIKWHVHCSVCGAFIEKSAQSDSEVECKKCRSTLEIFVKDDMVSVRPIHIRDEQLKSRMRTYSRKMMNQGS